MSPVKLLPTAILLGVTVFLRPTASARNATIASTQFSVPSPDAKAILADMAKVYETCTSYRDTGTVKTEFHPIGMGNIKPFSTAFVRPDRFRFEFKDGDGSLSQFRKYIVWRDGKQVKSWWYIGSKEEKKTSLGMALAGATGVSGASAHTIPRLLMAKEVGGWPIYDLKDLSLLDDERVDGRDCFRVSGRHSQGDTKYEILIEKKRLLVLKIRQESVLKATTAVTETKYDPYINEEIPDAAFKFNVPTK